jgi:hypothetical protein
VPCNPKSLGNWPEFVRLREQLAEEAAKALPRGYRDGTGGVEAADTS